MQAPSMGRHEPGCKLHPIFRTCNEAAEALHVGVTIPSALPTKIIFWHTCANRPWLVFHGLGLLYVFHQANPMEESGEEIDAPLNPLQVPLSDEAIICI